MQRGIKTPPPDRAPKPRKPKEFINKAPRIKAAQIRNYGKNSSTYSGNPENNQFGSGIGYGGDEYG